MRLVVSSDGTKVAWKINPTIDAGLVAVPAVLAAPPAPPVPSLPVLAHTGSPVRQAAWVAALLLVLGGLVLAGAGRAGSRRG
jgi:hypothetical protein